MPPKTPKKSAAAAETPKHVTITITDGDRKYRVRSDELGPGDDLTCRQQTGYPVGHFLENFSSDSMVVVIWIARRKSGEPNLAFQQVLAKYPKYADFDKLDADLKYDDGTDVEEGDAPLAGGD